MIRSSNPIFKKIKGMEYEGYEYREATYSGVGLKVLYYLLITFVGAFIGLYMVFNNPNAFTVTLVISALLGFISALVAMMKPNLSLVFGSIYCLCEGLFLGVISMFFEAMVPGVVITAVVGTFAIVLVSAAMFISGLIKITSKFYKFVIMASVGFIVTMALVYLFQLIGFISIDSFGLTLAIAAVSVLLASFYLLLDMEQAYQLVSNKGQKEMEWMVAFGISYTLLWIYVEVLRIAFILLANRD